MTRVLFVDDELNILRALRRVLRRVAGDWTVTFVGSGQEAIAAAEAQSFDAVVSDCLMPGMDGGELIRRLRQQHPGMVRVLLTGNAPTELMLAGEPVAHRMLAKPCPPEVLHATVESTLSAVRSLPEGPLRALVSGTPTLPTSAAGLRAITAVAGGEDEGADIQRLAPLVDGDPALEAKFLKLAHAGYFGGDETPCTGGDAARRLGPDSVSVLFRQGLPADSSIPLPLDLDVEHRHAERLGSQAARLAEHHGFDASRVTVARVAGRLLGVGRLVAAAAHASAWAGRAAQFRRPGLGSVEAERELLGVPANRIGAAMLALWGLPAPITAAIRGADAPEEGSLAELLSIADAAMNEGVRAVADDADDAHESDDRRAAA